MPSHYEATKPQYAACTATIFRGCEQGELIYWQFSGKWDELAAHFVDLNGKLDHAAKVALLRRRLSFFKLPGEAAAAGEWDSWGTGTQRNWDEKEKAA